jgi:hypothetical protein
MCVLVGMWGRRNVTMTGLVGVVPTGRLVSVMVVMTTQAGHGQ